MDGESLEGFQFEIGDYAIDYGRLVRIVKRETEYDYDLPHHHWYSTEDALTGEALSGKTRNDRLLGPLAEMEVLAWASS